MWLRRCFSQGPQAAPKSPYVLLPQACVGCCFFFFLPALIEYINFGGLGASWRPLLLKFGFISADSYETQCIRPCVLVHMVRIDAQLFWHTCCQSPLKVAITRSFQHLLCMIPTSALQRSPGRRSTHRVPPHTQKSRRPFYLE